MTYQYIILFIIIIKYYNKYNYNTAFTYMLNILIFLLYLSIYYFLYFIN